MMGIYLNPGNINFEEAVDSKIYVDKSMMIAHTNGVLRTKQKYICVSRPRRFGKSTTADMLVAYYSRGCDSSELFSKLKIAGAESFIKHLNQYNVIHINMIDFWDQCDSVSEMLELLESEIAAELTEAYPSVEIAGSYLLPKHLAKLFSATGTAFIFIIDEWDCVLRSKNATKDEQTQYLRFLRNVLKDKSYVALAYMTGIFPVKKYGEHSALNMFTEISMTDPREFAEFTGFTEDEFKALCERYPLSLEELKSWYDGYDVGDIPTYNPRSVVMALLGGYCSNYWTATETYEALKIYIQMDFDGLRDKVIRMISGEKVEINTAKFQNDMTNLHSADDVLTLLVHLGYLTYDFDTKTAWIPNSEVQQEFINSIEDGGWEEIMAAIRQSRKVLELTLSGKAEEVARLIKEVHTDNTSILKYNDENSLACVITLAYYAARKDYIIHRELAAGDGYADVVFIPRKNTTTPAMIVELKYNRSAEEAVAQIKTKNYMQGLKDYHGEVLLVGINYDEKKEHSCVIERATV